MLNFPGSTSKSVTAFCKIRALYAARSQQTISNEGFQQSQIIISLIIALGIGAVIASYYPIKSGEAQAIGSIVLVIITAFYARQIQQSLRETRRERERESILTILSEAITAIENQINTREEEYEAARENSHEDITSLPDVKRFHIPLEEHIEDISEDYPQFDYDIRAYHDLCEEYSGLQKKAKGEIKAYLENEFVDAHREELEDIEHEQSHDGVTDTQSASLEIAIAILEGKQEHILYVFEEYNEEFLALREDEFQGTVTELQRKFEEMRSAEEDLERYVTRIKSHYKIQIHDPGNRDHISVRIVGYSRN
jgi:hypothetical protein